MKNSILFVAILALAASCASNQSIVFVPANETVEIDYASHQLYRATLKNRSLTGLEVAVLSKSDNQQVSGFGLGTKAKVDVMVADDNKLVFKNKSKSGISIKMSVTKESPSILKKEGEYISFTLRNTSLKSIPLLIPSVMNPNLSPKSRSGVDLKVGQEILFRSGGKKYTLLTVDNSIKDGDEIDVATLLTDRKKELGLR